MERIAIIIAVVLVLVLSTVGGASTVGPATTVSAANADEFHPRIAYNGTRDEYLVVWHQYWPFVVLGDAHRIVMGQRLDRYGRALGTPFMISPAGDDRDRTKPDVAYVPDGDRYIVVYGLDFEGDGSDFDVRGRFIDWNGPNPGLMEFTVAQTTAHEWDPRVEYSTVSDSYLVTGWSEGTRAQVWGAVGAFGAPPAGSFIIAQDAVENRVDPDLASQVLGDTFLVVYSNAVDILGTLVGPSGSIGSEFAIAAWPDTENEPSVATCGELQYMVAWQSLVAPGDTEIYARPVWFEGSMVDGQGPFAISNYPIGDSSPDVSCRDFNYLIVYEIQYSNESGRYGIAAREIRAATASDTTYAMQPRVIVQPVISNDLGDVATRPAVAGGAASWLVAWEHDRTDDSYQDIRGAAVWQIFGAGFEWGNLSEWSATSP
jgi:hypothetical protein